MAIDIEPLQGLKQWIMDNYHKVVPTGLVFSISGIYYQTVVPMELEYKFDPLQGRGFQ